MNDATILLLFQAFVLAFLLRWLLTKDEEPTSRRLVRTFFMDGLRDSLPGMQGPVEEGDGVRFSYALRQGYVSLEQLYRRCEEHPDETGWIVRRAVLAVQRAMEDPDGLPGNWRDLVYPQLIEEEATRPDDLITRPFVDELIICYILDSTDTFRLVRTADLSLAKVTEEDLHTAAMRNLDRSGAGVGIDTLNAESDEHDTLLRFHSGDGLDAARLLMPGFFSRYSPRFGDTDLLVAIPTRDVMVVLADRDPAQATFLALRVDQEQRSRAYPLHSRLLRVSAEGVRSWIT
jgi:hypothetical protein